MKKIRGIKLVLLGVVLYLPYFIWSQITGDVPAWVFYISAALFAGCLVVGCIQIWTKKDDRLDDDLKRTMDERRVDSGK